MKRAQVSIYLVVAVLIAIIFGILFLFRSGTSVNSSIVDSQKTQIQMDQIESAVTICLDKASSEALYYAGRQGGRLYSDQSLTGTYPFVPLSYDYGKFIIPYKDYNVSYGIEAPINSNMQTFSVPAYPYNGRLVPNPIIDFAFQKKFADLRPQMQGSLPALCENNGPNSQLKIYPYSCGTYADQKSIEYYMEGYVERVLKECTNSIATSNEFKALGISSEKPIIDIFINDDDITFIAKYPVTMNSRSQSRELVFKSKKNIRFKQIYMLATGIIEKDTRDIFFDVVGDSGSVICQLPPPKNTIVSCKKAGMNVERYNDVGTSYSGTNFNSAYKHSDIINITDSKSLLDGRPYQFLFAVENRNPALDIIKETSGTKYQDKYDIVILQENPVVIDPFGFDPDDENKQGCKDTQGRDCMNFTYKYEFWKATYDELFEYAVGQSTGSVNITGMKTAVSFDPNCFPFNILALNPTCFPQHEKYTCPLGGCSFPSNLLKNEWEDSNEFKNTKRKASVMTSKDDIGPHQVRVSVIDSGGKIDYQDVNILVAPVVGGGTNPFYPSLSQTQASVEDPYTLQLANEVPNADNAKFKWFDMQMIDNTHPIGEIPGSDPNGGSYAKIILDKDINDPFSGTTPFKNPLSFFTPVGVNFDSQRLRLETTINGNPNNNYFNLGLRVCLPYKPAGTAPYPYHKFVGDTYNNEVKDDVKFNDFMGNHVCCKGKATDDMPYTDTSWGTYEDQNMECYAFNKQYIHFALIQEQYYDSSINKFVKEIPPANYTLDEKGNGISGKLNDPISVTVLMETVDSNGAPAIPDENDIIYRTLSQNCSGNRGNVCSGDFEDIGKIIRCHTKDDSKGEIASCQSPCLPDDLNCNQYDILKYDGLVGYEKDGKIKCFDYTSNDGGPYNSFENRFMKDGSDGICNPYFKCSKSTNSYNDDEFGDYLNKGICGGEGCNAADPLYTKQCSVLNSFMFKQEGFSDDGNDSIARFPNRCAHNINPKTDDKCEPDTDISKLYDLDDDKSFCDGASSASELGDNKIVCGNDPTSSCFVSSGEIDEFGEYKIGENGLECCGDDPDEKLVTYDGNSYCCDQLKGHVAYDSDSGCTTEECVIKGVTIICEDTDYDNICSAGEGINVKVEYTGCNSGDYYITIEAEDSYGECLLKETDAITNNNNPTLSGSGDDIFVYYPTNIPTGCEGKTVYPISALITKSTTGESLSYTESSLQGSVRFAS